MPTKKPKKIDRKQWWTIAYYDREGNTHPLTALSNFTQYYKSERVMLEDLEYGMKNFHVPRGIYAAMVWSGQVSPRELVIVPPKFTIYEGGSAHVHT